MAISKSYKQISITRLILNPENDRFEPVENEKLALEMMLQKMGSKIYFLAADIVNRGLSPKPFYVIPHYNKYVVKDGNRRTTAIKFLSRPKLIDEKKYPTLRLKFEKLHNRYIQSPIKSILSYVYPDALSADNWVELEHTGEQKGVGTVEWESEEIHRFNKKHGKNPPIQIQAMDFIRNSVFISDEIKEMSEQIKLTNFERFINDTNIRKLLGISWINSQLISGVEESEIAKGFSRIVYEMNKPNFTVKSIYTAKDRADFIKKFSDGLPDLSKTTTPWSLNNWSIENDDDIDIEKLSNETEGGQKSPPIHPINKPSNSSQENKSTKSTIPVTRKSVIPSNLAIRIANPKANKIYNELKKIDVKTFVNCAAVTLRVFLELSVDSFLEAKGLLKEGEISASLAPRSLYQKVNDVSQYLHKNKLADESITMAVKLLTKEKNSVWGVDTMHAYVHSNKLSPIPGDIQTTWDNIQDFMLTLWAQIEAE